MDIRHEWFLKCLICGTTQDQLRSPRLDKSNLVLLQEHVMGSHGYTTQDLRKNLRRGDFSEVVFTMPDGRDWLKATWFSTERTAVGVGRKVNLRKGVRK